MRDFDTIADVGIEPNTIGGGRKLYTSPDIWINQNEDPADESMENVIYEQTNYVHIKIHNKDTIPSSGTEQLEVYYAKASTGLTWPYSWINETKSFTENNISVTRKTGDRINKSPIYLHSIPANSTHILAVKWDELPDINDFEENPIWHDNRHYCLLARIVRSENAPNYGMTYEEGPTLWRNTKNNNAVAWRNVSIVRDDGNLTSGGGNDLPNTPSMLGYNTNGLLVGNNTDSATTTTLTFELPTNSTNASLFNDGKVQINLDQTLFKQWADGGYVGEGISVAPLNLAIRTLNSNLADTNITTISIDSNKAWIGNLQLPPKEIHEIIVGIQVNDNVDRYQNYQMNIEQFDDYGNGQDFTGGEVYEVYHTPCPVPNIASVQLENQVVLSANSSASEVAIAHQWILNANWLANDTLPVLNTYDEGVYQVLVTYPSGCSALSERVTVTQNIVKQLATKNEPDFTSLNAYPNPASNHIVVNYPENTSNIYILAIDGKMLTTLRINKINQKTSAKLDVSSLPNGQYFIKNDGANPQVISFIKNH